MSRQERGALSVQTAVMFPLIAAFSFLLLQLFFVLSTVTSVEKAARDGARAAMAGRSVPVAVENAVPDWLTVESITSGNGTRLCPGRCVTVEARVPLGIPAFTVDSLTVSRAAAMPERHR